jgi:hypothetical protein
MGMSPALAPPRPPVPGAAEALFAQARRRRRRRRLTGVAVVLTLAAAAAVTFAVTRPHRALVASDAGGGRAGTAGVAVAGSVAWVDYHRRVHLGDLATAAQRVVATINANPALPLVQAGGHLYWVGGYWANRAGTYVPAMGHSPEMVQELDPATGKIRDVGPGQGVFPSADGRHLFLSPTDSRLIELPARGFGASRRLTLPEGWYVPYGQSLGVAGGVLVQSDRKTWARTVIAVWNPTTGAVQVVGRGYQVLAAYTPPGGHYSLLAWLPAACAEGQDCPLNITNTATLATRTVRSPLRHGFAFGGAFSPDGTRLAVFADANSDATGAVQLAMVNTGTGALRLAGSVRLAIGAPVAWALWLPDGRYFLTGGAEASYVVNAATLSARPLFFMRGSDRFMPSSDRSIQDSQDLNYSAVVVPLRR